VTEDPESKQNRASRYRHLLVASLFAAVGAAAFYLSYAGTGRVQVVGYILAVLYIAAVVILNRRWNEGRDRRS
jgi:hypothetical protein